MITWIAAVSCLLAVIPAALFLRNLSALCAAAAPRPPRALAAPCSSPRATKKPNIAAALHSVLHSE